LLEGFSGNNTESNEALHKSSFQAFPDYSFHQNTWACQKPRPSLPLDDAGNIPTYLLEACHTQNNELELAFASFYLLNWFQILKHPNRGKYL
jgi:hypothetical protein